MTSIKSNKAVMKILHKLDRYDKNEKIFIGYLFVLLLFILITPVIKVTWLKWSEWYGVWLYKSFPSLMIVLISMIILIWWNVSFKFKNLFLTYFGGRDNKALINFLFLFIIATVYFWMTDAVRVASWVTSTIKVAWGCIFVEILLLLWIVFTLISVVKNAKEMWKKTKIINVIDEEKDKHEEMKEEIKKGLFETEE